MASRATALWGGVAALSFAIAGTVQEFLGSCVFIFIKHPYDVGDRVEINSVSLIVEHISLLYTIFRQVDSGANTQIPNIVNNGQWIKNISRSKAMSESYHFSISSKTKFDAIENLNAELQSFIQDNRRDFQPEVDVELISVGNLKELVLRVEVCHKV
jgi:small-conductance mechanosensitive channel